MAPGLLSFNLLTSVFPTKAFIWVKRLLTREKLTVLDGTFKLVTKWTTVLLLVMTCIAFGNQFVRSVEIDCSDWASGNKGGGDWPRPGGGGGSGSGGSKSEDEDWNTYCWNKGTFLVERGLDPSMKSQVEYPGVTGYSPKKDAAIEQTYYSKLWLLFMSMAAIAFAPCVIWKFMSLDKIRGIVNIPDAEFLRFTEEDVRVSIFIEIIGTNGILSTMYVYTKIWATMTPILLWTFSTMYLGGGYATYGWDVLRYIFIRNLVDSAVWPNPMDVLFPKVAKCQRTHVGYAGDMEMEQTLCQLPMNGITSWTFLCFYWWCWMVFFLSFFSMMYLIAIAAFPCLRNYEYRSLISTLSPAQVDIARTKVIEGQQKSEKTLFFGWIQPSQSERLPIQKVLKTHIGFGEWLILSLIESNLEDYMYRAFIRRLAVTTNPILQFKYRPPKVVFGKCICKNVPSSSNPIVVTVIPKTQEPSPIEDCADDAESDWEKDDDDTVPTAPLASTTYSSYAPKSSTGNKVIDGVVCTCRRKQDPTNSKVYLYNPISLDRTHQVREERNRRQRKRDVISAKNKKATWGKNKSSGYSATADSWENS